ncbi:hypothetical protein JK636_11785 [Clostridium sp. YIM B02515]|uniref:DUF4181 domain-containing protein n=1 Tax=Clostridium rhizosphaerae TaxID=2803861 RepID=A0ABS1TCS9_9CLOT|nr:hypothetical protein [Clostridium rhizosphaerae]MBL4936441.1 hypothetical protein [Clostridium rhizosphaerae]
MSWKLEIYRAIFVAFGMFEIISNLIFLSLKNGMNLARKQHQEIPKEVTKKQLKTKVMLMFILGLLFFLIGIASFILRNVNETYFLLALILFATYAVGEALYYKYWKTLGFSAVSILFLLGFLL